MPEPLSVQMTSLSVDAISLTVPVVQAVAGELDFYKLYTLHRDLSVTEQLFVIGPPEKPFPYGPPDVITQSKTPKSSSRVIDDFIAPEGPAEIEHPGLDPSIAFDPEFISLANQKPRVIDLRWLQSQIEDLDEASGGHEASDLMPFENYLRLLDRAIKNKADLSRTGISLL